MGYQAEYMHRALALADQAAALGEVPVGAVIVHQGRILAEAYNRRELQKDPLAHAEILAIGLAAEALGGWRLSDCELYVTLEPCIMCAGAIVQARIDRIYIGALDPKAGAVVSRCQLWEMPWLNHKPEFEFGHEAEAAATKLKAFFKVLRQRGTESSDEAVSE